MGLLAKLQAIATALDDIVTKAPQAQTALDTLNTFLDSIT